VAPAKQPCCSAISRFPFLYHCHIVLNYNLFKTGLLSCVFLAFFACKQGAESTYLSTLRREHDIYLHQFQQSADTLQKQSDQIKLHLNATANAAVAQKIESFDKKLGVYRESYTTKLDRYQQLIKKFESGAIPKTEMATYQESYTADFKTYEDAFSQLKTFLDGLAVEAGGLK
jgi:hypothetical protein